jgi:HEAT repeat protein
MRQVAASNDTDTEVRSQAIFWLGQRGTPEDLDFLRGLYPKLQNRELKEQLLSTMARRKGSSDWLLGIALDPKEPMDNRATALFWAGQGGAPVEQMVALYDKTSDREMKEALINVYRQRGPGPAFEKLLDIAKHEKDPELRKSAFYWVSRSKDPRVDKLLEDLIAGGKP